MMYTDKTVLVLLIALFSGPSQANWFEDAVSIVGDIGEDAIRFANLPLPVTKGEHNCGDEVQYMPSEENAWRFRGVHAYYNCCEGYERFQKYDQDCSKPICAGRKSCGDRGACIEPGKCCCRPGYIGEHNGCQRYICMGTHNCGNRGTCIGPNRCKCKDGYRGTRVGCRVEQGDDYDPLQVEVDDFPDFTPNIPSRHSKPALKALEIALVVIGCLLVVSVFLMAGFLYRRSKYNQPQKLLEEPEKYLPEIY